MERRIFLTLAIGLAVAPKLFTRESGSAVEDGIDLDPILRDHDAPVAGNPDGDVILAAFSDYNCPFCKATARDMDRAVAEDGRVRLVNKDWPILTDASLYGARLALAARYRGGYEMIHRALMGFRAEGYRGSGCSPPRATPASTWTPYRPTCASTSATSTPSSRVTLPRRAGWGSTGRRRIWSAICSTTRSTTPVPPRDRRPDFIGFTHRGLCWRRGRDSHPR